MTRHTGRTAALACALAASFTAAALAETPAEMFARPVEYGDATLSPTGEYVAVTTPFEDRHALSIIKLSGNYDRSLIKFEAKERPFNPVWTDDSRLIVEKVKDYGYVGSLVRTGNIYAANADASKQVELFGYRPDQGNVRSRVKDEGTADPHEAVAGNQGRGAVLLPAMVMDPAQFEEHHVGIPGRYLHRNPQSDCNLSRRRWRGRRQRRHRALRMGR